MLALGLAALLGACGTLPPRAAVKETAALAPDPGTALAKIVAASTPPGEH